MWTTTPSCSTRPVSECRPAITTDSKTVPALMGRRLAEGLASGEAFRRTVAECEGSVAVAVCTAGSPDRLQLALRGSGQALYVGLADDAFIVASEPYGVVEETSDYLRMDGEAVAGGGNPDGGRGQIVELDGSRAGLIDGVSRHSYDGTPLPVAPDEVSTAAITTRDIDRGDHRHYLLKEIGEAPASFRKTLRGRIIDTPDGPGPSLGPEALPEVVRSGLRDRSVAKVVAIGQGTAAVAGESFARCLRTLLADAGCAAALDVRALLATELSAFHLTDDMSDTLVVAISQSGTTTDTNRTVDLVRARGGSVVAVVNRRNSDLTDRADGVLYTSDGRDVEMSVASTKAFYSQVAAGCLLAVAVAGEVAGERGAAARRSLLETLRSMPSVLEAVLERRAAIGETARRLAPGRRHWAVVGNGPNQVAAREVRIKLSELCYRSISADATEDKKHIDLSAEPLVLVCAAGLSGSVADDVAKEVAIFGAHRAAPVVVADDGDTRYEGASAVLPVPRVDPRLAFLPATMVGHLFGYEAALAIDAGAQPLREARAAIEAAAALPDSTAEEVLRLALPALRQSNTAFSAGLRRGDYNGHLEASTAVRIVTLMRFAVGLAPLDVYELELGRIGTPEALIDDLEAALSVGIDELTRPVDAIRHQAKTVTVGISRSDQTLLEAPLIRAVLASGAPRDNLSYSTVRALADLSPAVAEVLGHTRYRLDGLEGIAVVDQGGIATQITSRTSSAPSLTGSKRRVAGERRVLAARGRHDGRTVVFVPEVAAGATVGITLLHVRFEDFASGPGGPKRPAGVPQSLLGATRRGHRDRTRLRRGPSGRDRGGRSADDPHRRPSRPLAYLARPREVRRYRCGVTEGVMSSSDAGVVGIGTDLVDVDRFRTVLRRRPSVADRLFTPHERTYAERAADPAARLAARFAAKEAALKALGYGLGGMRMAEIEVVRDDDGRPGLVLHGAARSTAATHGVGRWLVSLSHTDHLAQATVVALGT